MATSHELWECIERNIQEIDVLDVIFGSSQSVADGRLTATAFPSSSFSILSDQQELDELRRIVNSGTEIPKREILPTNFHVEIKTPIEIPHEIGVESSSTLLTCLRIRLDLGYPEFEAACITSLSIKDNKYRAFFHRSIVNEMLDELNEKARSLVGQEAILDIIESAKGLVTEHVKSQQQTQKQSSSENTPSFSAAATYGRRWIWVHHITDSERKKSILREAESLHLGGFFKYGYPGVVVVEGTTASCNEFVIWIKGNKSRPGGFGRNWGHHVRGEINIENESGKKLPTHCEEMEDLSILSRACRKCGLEDEFLKFVMQHKGSNSG
ncbi:DUF1115 domain containing protein [Nitzschia inconspicua]|uniref:DUF1115 domain containing protein n=1 Tax=Nitzschia inconspicua TaxID=303405 RepID=A0A9K3KXL0_9STRA|nr:DUF1115 domain containing protein [Nitzschia inconspicua]